LKWFLLLGGVSFAAIVILRVVINNLMMRDADAEGNHFFEDPKVRVSALVMVTSMIVVLIAVAYQLLYNRFRNEQKNLALINEQQAAQLQFLKAQINPHFLFNALNNVYSLTVAKSDDAPKMLLKLSDLLRYVIYESQKETVDLAREAQHIRQFIELFQMRSEAPLSIQFTTTGNLSGVPIEPMILIPLVENCFKHCDFDQNPNAFTNIQLETTPQYIRFFSQNTFDKTDQQKDAVGGVGLENIQRRLALRYAERFDLHFGENAGVFTVELKIKMGDNVSDIFKTTDTF
jgi:LytS/YehU family sensor histidine kinase